MDRLSLAGNRLKQVFLLMLIINSTEADLESIFQLFEKAIVFQKSKFPKHWQGFDPELIRQEIAEKRHWKIMLQDELALIFSITYEDALIWGDKSQDPAMYIHRIASNPLFRGRGFMKQIMAWAQGHARATGQNFIRMDTWADNENLIHYYVDCGFKWVGIKALHETAGLPRHYEGNDLSLFEIPLPTIHSSMSKFPTTLERLAAYNLWANEVLVQALEDMADPLPPISLHLLSHICNAQVIWLSRIENTSKTVGVFDEHTLAGCRELLISSSDQLLELAAMPAMGLMEVISYTNTQGDAFQTSVEDILIQVFNHGTYHRAQIARDLRQNGLTPVNTDYITYVRALSAATG
jgi:uncharacterized damage-inducible protein DinB/GNAT superfamily N-acetyltransferase